MPAGMTRTLLDTAGVVLGDSASEFSDELLTLAGPMTVAAGTILARDSVSLKLVIYVKGGSTNQNGVPKAVLLTDIVAAGAADFGCRALVKGEVNQNRLIIQADGTAANIDNAVRDQLRAFGITPVNVKQLAGTDN